MSDKWGWLGQAQTLTTGSSIFYYSGTVFGSGADLVLATSDYASYGALVASGTIPPINEGITKSDGSATIQVLNHTQSSLYLNPGEIEVRVQCVNRDLDLAKSLLMQLSVEVWSAKQTISASRQFVDFNNVGFGKGLLGVHEQSFTLTGGNPGDRSGSGIIQANGLYKLTFNIALPNLPAISTPRTIYISAIVRPTQIATTPNIIIPQLP